MWKKLCEKLGQSSFRKILCTILILFTVVPVFAALQILAHIYEKNMIRNTCINVTSAMEANNRNLDVLLGNIETTAQLMVNSDLYYNIFSELADFSVPEYLKNDRRIRTELARQFSLRSDIWDAYFYVPGWTLGDNHSRLSDEEMQAAGYAEIAHQAGEGETWITGYDYGERIHSEFLMKKKEYDYQYLLTMVKEMNFQYSFHGVYYALPEMEELPVLVVHVKEQTVRDTYKDSIDYENSLYVIANKDGNVVSTSSDDFTVSKKLPEVLFEYYGENGYKVISYHGTRYLLCYDAMPERSLTAFSLVPMEAVANRAVADTRKIQYILLGIMGVLSVVTALILSRYFSRPIGELVKASKRVGHGDFSADTPVPNQKEFGMLTRSFNDMEKKISKLIYENYEIRIREKENLLAALSMQINPHFLYNTLNTIHIMALQNGDFDTSEVIISLSEMLQYTVRNQSEKGTLEDETAWLSNYLYIMSKRYQNVFHTDMEIDESLMGAKIPKLLFQPFLENAIIHGFSVIDHPGIIRIQIKRENDWLVTVISDNGKGMEMQDTKNWVNLSHKEGHVGISNVYQRLKLYYGECFELKIDSGLGKGTNVTIKIPYEES